MANSKFFFRPLRTQNGNDLQKKKNPKEKVSVARHGVVPLKMANLICISNHPMLLILREEGEVFKR